MTSPNTLPETFDHIIVGGGIIGASIAYHLKCIGAGSVLVLERNELASAASSRAAGLILQASPKPTKISTALKTVELVPTLKEELGEDVGFHGVGSVRVAASDQRVQELQDMVEHASDHGIPFEWLDPKDTCERVPWLNAAKIIKAVFFPTDGYADPYMLTMSYVRAAQAQGAVFRPRSAVTDVLTSGGSVTGVRTNAGEVASGSVIDACGVWAALFSARVGYPLPMAPVRSHYWITESAAAYGGEHPVTVMPDIAAYTRPDVGGLLLGVQEPSSATFDARDLPDDPAAFSPTKGEDHWDILADAFDGIASLFPGVASAQFSNYIAGLSSYTPDGKIILGAVPGVSGFYAAAGMCGSGITLSAGVGNVMADLVLGHEPAVDISPFRPDRFGNIDPFSQDFRDQCAAARASKSRKLA
jgi:sarcosine oxidase subunit beta